MSLGHGRPNGRHHFPLCRGQLLLLLPTSKKIHMVDGVEIDYLGARDVIRVVTCDERLRQIRIFQRAFLTQLLLGSFHTLFGQPYMGSYLLQCC